MKKRIIAGADESGIGPLAGPITCCIVTICASRTPRYCRGQNKDSKSLSPQKREEIFDKIKTFKGIEWKTSSVWPKTIDRINVLQANFLAFTRCVKKLKRKPEIIFIDGNKTIPNVSIPQVPIIKGDKKHPLIALASVIAKVKRDKIMKKLSKKFPQYKFEIHKGYPTKLHLSLLKKYKPCSAHRKSYSPVFKNLSFKQRVLYIVSKIKKGEVLTYKQVAELAGSPQAYRAVGNILSKNYNPQIPCHRVIKSNGEIGGYNRGEKKKKELLELEA